MNKIQYARKMVEFHSRLLIKWLKYIEKYNKNEKSVENETIKGQMTIFDLED